MKISRVLYRRWFSVFLIPFLVNTTAAIDEYPNGFPNDPTFFPVGVWLQSPERALAYKAIGINTFVGLWKGPTESQLATLAENGMFVVTSQNEVGLHSVNRSIIKGWLHDDEPDNARASFKGLHVTCIPVAEVVHRTEEMRARDGTRPIVLNFGQGIVNRYWWGRGLCTGDENYYFNAARGVDILSFDIYPVAAEIPQVKGKLEYVARGVTRLMNIAVTSQKVWALIETTALNPKIAVRPDQVRAEIWMALIHGARGIVYFVHEFSPVFREDAIFRHPDVVKEVARQNELIRSLASVLNNPNLDGTVSVQSNIPIATMVKRHKNVLYIFAVAMKNSPSRPRFRLEGIDDARAVVVDENRDVAVAQGFFEDSFDGYGLHIYEVPLTAARN